MCPSERQSLVQTHRLHFTADDRQRQPYCLLPFEVEDPASLGAAGSIARITVQYTFTGGTAADPRLKNVVDIGLFDPRGSAFLTTEGFRGWSGSARSTVSISPTKATPGYLPGPIYTGTWHVLLGLAQISPSGCDVTVTITLDCGPGEEAIYAAYVSPGVLRATPGWYRGDLHCHTYHSDAQGSVADLAAAARMQTLDFLAVTDHNTISHLPELAQHSDRDLLLIPGIEITTHRGHANVWGIREWIDFRATTDAELDQIRACVRERRLPFSINHPKYGGPEWTFGTVADADAIEAWQAPWWFSNHESLTFWDNLLRQGKRINLVGGSDKHQKPFDGQMTAHEVGMPTTWVYAETLSEQAILDGIRAGHVFVSHSPQGPQLALTASVDGHTVMMGDAVDVDRGTEIAFQCRVQGGASCSQGDTLLRVMHREGEARRVRIDDDNFSFDWQAVVQGDDYWRVELIESTNVPLDKDPVALWAFALSNPIYV
ncbi:MAG: CehA/McbA family metallohydrolase [Anaerolineae bacterium]|nr:CehA/McbA family metallohydrolase [Anaerolineae bacterium]